jgi:hypothetical protein
MHGLFLAMGFRSCRDRNQILDVFERVCYVHIVRTGGVLFPNAMRGRIQVSEC